MSEKLHQEKIMAASESVRLAQKQVNPEFRQWYHFMAPAGWLNDPNGLIQFRGQYHLFYQHNPYAAKWGPMHWGHAVSSDLVHWKHLPVALAPSECYEEGSRGGCFSGSAVEKDGKLILIYTGARSGERAEQAQCLAFSEDGIHFRKYAGNPILRFGSCGARDFRDPKVWKHGEHWYLAAVLSADGNAEILLYESTDLIHWRLKGIPVQSGLRMGDVWECPDYFELGGKGIFLFSPVRFPGHKSSYLTGILNDRDGTFQPDQLGEIDWGFDFYAAQSFQDEKGRRIIIGWANSWDWMPWWRGYGPVQKDLWCGFLSLPREAFLCKDGMLSFQPVDELKELRQNGKSAENLCVSRDSPLSIGAGDGIHYELLAELDWDCSDCLSFCFLLRCSEREETKLEFYPGRDEMMFDRSRADQFGAGKKKCSLRLHGRKSLDVHIFSDTCSIEVFANGGKAVFTSCQYPLPESRKTFLTVSGGAIHVRSLRTWRLKPAVS